MEKTVITVVGKDTTGIIARSSTYLYTHNINILDIAQTVLDGIFNMMMIVDVSGMDISYEELVQGLSPRRSGSTSDARGRRFST